MSRGPTPSLSTVPAAHPTEYRSPHPSAPGYGAPPPYQGNYQTGYGAPPSGHPPHPQGHFPPPQGYAPMPQGSPQPGYGRAPPPGYYAPPSGYGSHPPGFGAGYAAPSTGYGPPPGTYGELPPENVPQTTDRTPLPGMVSSVAPNAPHTYDPEATGSVTPTGGLYSNEARIEEAVAIAQEKGYINPENEAKIAKAVSIAEETANAIRSGASVSEVLTGLKKHLPTCPHCEKTYLRAKIRKRTNQKNCIIGALCLPCYCAGLYCLLGRKEKVKHCTNCGKQLDPGNFYCQEQQINI